MHFLDAWTRLDPATLLRLALAPGSVLIAILLPGRRPGSVAALGLAAACLVAPGLGLAARVAWVGLWLAVALAISRSGEDETPTAALRRGGIESGTVGLLLALALALLLVAAVARQDLPGFDGRQASYAILMIALGLAHLMLRRHVLRAALAVGAMAFGLDGLMRAAAARQISPPGPALAVPLAAALAVGLVLRISRSRRGSGGGAWVSGAHDLHD